ncbi:MAG: BLUF domain-containing protein [Hoeflea sp.]|uniref:BLUF domain-containing protein n=1 Tax=Hoeflea sp. TaxID=1940281 RepID=UPI0032EDDBBE
MIQLLYVSGASREISERDLDDILRTSRKNNQHNGITGMLLWADGVFIQILEGEPDRVRRLVSRIQGDPRHCYFMVMHEQTTDERLFSDWSMGFKKLDPQRASDSDVFALSKAALAERVGDNDGGMFFDIILAFSRDFLSEVHA